MSWVVAGTFWSEAEAHIAAAALEAHGIPSRVAADNAGGALPAMSLVFPVRVLVAPRDLLIARRLLTSREGEDPDG